MHFTGFVMIFLIGALIERLYEWRFSHQAERGQRKMEWSYTALHSLYLAVFAGAAAERLLYPHPVQWWVSGVGGGLFIISMVVRLTAIRTLGRFWSLHLEIRDQHQLVTEGIYRYLRHPAYSSIMLEVIAVPLVANAYGSLLLSVGAYLPVLLARWRREEREMIGRFGEQYVAYRQRVPAFFPWPRGQ